MEVRESTLNKQNRDELTGKCRWQKSFPSRGNSMCKGLMARKKKEQGTFKELKETGWPEYREKMSRGWMGLEGEWNETVLCLVGHLRILVIIQR